MKILTLVMTAVLAISVVEPVKNVNAARYNWYPVDYTTLNDVSRLDEEVIKSVTEYKNIGSYLVMGSTNSQTNTYSYFWDGVAIKVPMASKKDGIVQLRLHFDDNYGTVNVKVIREKDIDTAAALTGRLVASYNAPTTQDSTVQGFGQPHVGETTWNVALEGGQNYYFVIERAILSAQSSGQNTRNTVQDSSVSYAMVYKEADSQGSKSTVTLKNGDKKYEFYTLTYPRHEYVFSAPADSDSTLYMSFDGETAEKRGSALVEVYNEYNELIKSQTYNGSDASMKKEFVLSIEDKDRTKNHTYTAKITGLYGNGTVRLEQNLGSVSAKIGTASANGYEITLDIKEIKVQNIKYFVNSPYDNVKENNDAWNTANTVDKNSGKFYAKENGHYIVRVLSTDNKKYFCEFDIDDIDSVAPTVNVPLYNNKAVKIEIDSKDKDIAYIELNGHKVANGAIIAGEGTHTVKFVDKSGNETSKTFYIDKTRPDFDSQTIKDGGTVQAGYNTFSIKDGLSGLDYVYVDGVAQTYLSNMGIQVVADGSLHTIQYADKSGNESTIMFYSQNPNGTDKGQVGGDGSGSGRKDDEGSTGSIGGN